LRGGAGAGAGALPGDVCAHRARAARHAQRRRGRACQAWRLSRSRRHGGFMGQIRRRDSVEIRARALRMAVVKSAAGCLPCAAAYLKLARAHQADADETPTIKRTGSEVQTAAPAVMDRRAFLKVAAVGTGVVVASVQSLLGPMESMGRSAA